MFYVDRPILKIPFTWLNLAPQIEDLFGSNLDVVDKLWNRFSFAASKICKEKYVLVLIML